MVAIEVIDQLEVIKSLANCTQTVHILLGTYDLLRLRQLNGQLGRRSLDIHFSRYSAESQVDLRIFKNIILTFQERLPLDEQPDLVPLWDLLYERSVGCVGILKEWLDRALIASLKEGCETMAARHLETTALSASQCEKIAVEALRKEYRSQAEAGAGIAAAIEGAYKTGDRAAVERAATAIVAIYDRNVFPEMRVKWGSYPNNLGHMDFPGCFRCHDGNHVSSDSRSIPGDCDTCHKTLAMDEVSPKILTDPGIFVILLLSHSISVALQEEDTLNFHLASSGCAGSVRVNQALNA